MTLWLVLTIMTSVAAVLVSAPFIRRLDRAQAEPAGEIEVYRDQLKEVESELRQGVIDEMQAETARVEIKRRALSADRMAQPAMPKLSHDERNFAVICVTGIVVLGSVGLYAATGSPDLLSVGRTDAAQRSRPLDSFAGATRRPGSENLRQPQSQASLPPVKEMIRRLATRLLQNPNDAEGWRTLGWSYASIGRFADAGEAYAKAIELRPDFAEIRSARIEALVKAADGSVTADARKAIDETLRLDPKDERARFFKGLAKEQDGDKAAALTDWVELLKEVKSDEPLAPELRARIGELELELGVAVAGPAAAKPRATSGLLEALRAQRIPQMPPAAEKEPSQEDVRAAAAMPAADRSAMIQGMVDGLASRLEQSPRDADGWIKLIRSRMVLGETALAKQALARGIEVFADDKQQQDRIAAAAQQFGLAP